MAVNHTITAAVGSLTLANVIADTETVTVGGKVYTFQTVLTNVNGNVLIGANAAASLQNFYDAINLSGTPGTQYAAAMTVNTRVKAFSVSATVLVVKALTPGEVGNLIATTETLAGASNAWGAAVLASGAGNVNDFIVSMISMTGNINSEVLSELKKLTVAND